jgi:hypothetical protein
MKLTPCKFLTCSLFTNHCKYCDTVDIFEGEKTAFLHSYLRLIPGDQCYDFKNIFAQKIWRKEMEILNQITI